MHSDESSWFWWSLVGFTAGYVCGYHDGRRIGQLQGASEVLRGLAGGLRTAVGR